MMITIGTTTIQGITRVQAIPAGFLRRGLPGRSFAYWKARVRSPLLAMAMWNCEQNLGRVPDLGGVGGGAPYAKPLHGP